MVKKGNPSKKEKKEREKGCVGAWLLQLERVYRSHGDLANMEALMPKTEMGHENLTCSQVTQMLLIQRPQLSKESVSPRPVASPTLQKALHST